MILLAMDTSTSAITTAVHDGHQVLAERSVLDARAHTENLAPLLRDVLAAAGLTPADVTDVAVGVGPGPFTGLRVGLVTARTFAYALGLPCHGVVSLDALAHAAARSGAVRAGAVGADEVYAGEFVVATDARRKEVYWARYALGDDRAVCRTEPAVARPADLDDAVTALPAVGRGALLYPEVFTRPAGPLDVSAADVAEVALAQLAEGIHVGIDALYLRRPDALPSVNVKPTLVQGHGSRR